MQNIHEILKAYGLEVPSDKKADFDKAMIDNYKTVAEVQKVNDKLKKTEQELTTAKQSLSDITGELQSLKDSNANAADWEKKFNDLSADIAEKEKQAKLEREAKEKADMIESRFNTVVGDRKFTHEAIKADYLHKFGEALDNKDFMGTSDADIFHELIKDDKHALENVQMQLNMPGGQPAGGANQEPKSLLEALQAQYENKKG